MSTEAKRHRSSTSSSSSSTSTSASSSSSSHPPPPSAPPSAEELILWAGNGDEALISAALANPLTDPNATDESGTTALAAAVTKGREGRLEVAKLLLADARVDPNLADFYGRTPLMYATTHRKTAMLRLLVSHARTAKRCDDGINGRRYFDAALAWLSRQGAHGEAEAVAAPVELIPAVEDGDEATVRSALRNSLTDPNATAEDGNTALTAAVLYRRDNVLALLLADERTDPNATIRGGRTAVKIAAFCRRTAALKLLLADGRTERARPHNGGDSYDAALAWLSRQGAHEAEAAPEELIPAARDGDEAIVASALRNPLVDPNMVDEDGSSALHWAARLGLVAVVEALLKDKRVDPNIPDLLGSTALKWAVTHQFVPIMELLLADHRTTRARPVASEQQNWHLSISADRAAAYDAALRNVKRPRRARFRGLVRAFVALRRLRLRAAQAAYAPGGAGFAAAAASFNAATAAAAAAAAATATTTTATATATTTIAMTV
jgi:ankyrin repeat protein